MTELTGRPAAVVYDRVAAVYDWYTTPMEALGARRARRRLFARARGRVLDLGVGTGLNLPSYPPGVELVGIDISPRMLARARRRAARLGLTADLQVGDIEALPYADASFDTVTAACVFCSVDDPVGGLREAARVVRPAGQVNGQPGLVAQQDGITVTVFAFDIAGDRIKHIWAVATPRNSVPGRRADARLHTIGPLPAAATQPPLPSQAGRATTAPPEKGASPRRRPTPTIGQTGHQALREARARLPHVAA